MRWKVLFGILAVVSLVVIFYTFFLDSYAKAKIIDAVSSVTRSKVEIDNLYIDIRKQSVTISGFHVADPKDPWKNMFEIKSASFDFSLGDALMGHFVIDNLSADTPQWGTKRETWGGLKKKETSEKEEKPKKGIEWKKYMPSFDFVKDFDFQKLAKLEDMESVKKLEASKKLFGDKGADWKKLTGEYETELKLLAAGLAGGAVLAIANREKLDAELEKVKDFKSKIEKARDDIKKDIAEAAKIKDIVADLRDSDIKGAVKKAGLGGDGEGGITQKILAEPVKEKISGNANILKDLTLNLIGIQEGPQHMEGTTVQFPLYNPLPAFYMKKASFKMFADRKEGNWFSGSISDVSSDQDITKKPASMNIAFGSQDMPGVTFDVNGKSYFQKDRKEYDVTFDAKGIETSSVQEALGPDSPVEITGGSVKASGSFNFKDDIVRSDFNVIMSNIKTSARKDAIGGLDAGVLRVLDKSLSSVTYINLKGKAEGKIDDLKVSITSDLDKILQKVADDAVSEAKAEIERKIREELEREIGKRLPEVTAMLIDENGKLKNIDEEVTKIKKDLESEIKKYEKLAKEELEKKKKEAKEELNKAKKVVKEKKEEVKTTAQETKKKADDTADKAKELQKKAKDLKLPKF
ncbi:MAG: hypothetical protein OEY64_03925 [Nitrospinota bacterium]|nr:hypothetical protein [Nitrospinota bacterium]